MSVGEKSSDLAEDASPRGAPIATRIDTAHVHASDAPVVEARPAPQHAELLVASGAQQMRSQATQLATHLQRQQTAIDHRESELNARLAAMENQIRGARLWLAERHAEFDRREQQIIDRENRLAADLDARDDVKHRQREAELDRRAAELEALAARLSGRADAEKAHDLHRVARTLDTRAANLERAETLLANERAELDQQRQSLAQEKIRFAETSAAQGQKQAEDRLRSVSELEKTRRELKRQSDELAARQTALERMRADVARAQHEGLEVRLATEELWARLCGSMAPAALTRSLAQIRLKLADEHRLARAELAQQKDEVQSLASRVAEQHEKMTQQRDELQNWATRRQHELEQHAGRLVAARTEIDAQQGAIEEERRRWETERLELQQEIRRLLRQTDPPRQAAA